MASGPGQRDHRAARAISSRKGQGMTDENKAETTEKHFRNLVESLTPEKARQIYGSDVSKINDLSLTVILRAAAAYLSVCSTDRQEKILTEQRKMLESMNEQSVAMNRQTTWLLRFTVALFVAVIVQIVLAAVLLSRS